MKTRTIAILAAALLAAAVPGAADDVLRPVREIAVQDGGRVKPLDSFARETARKVAGARAFGAESVQGLDPVRWMTSMMADPARWQDVPIVRVSHAGVRTASGLPHARDRYSFHELVRHDGFRQAAQAVEEKLSARRNVKLDPVEQEVWDLYGDLSLLSAIFAGDLPRVVPHPTDARAEWASLGALLETAGTAPAGQAAQAFLEAARRGDESALAAAATGLTASLRATAGAAYPPATDLAREVHYNRAKPFRTAWLLSLLASLALLVSFPVRSRVAAALGYGALVASFAAQAYGLGLRTVISGRAPVTNMYETVIFVSWGAILFALAFELSHRVKYFAVCAGWLSVILLILADNVPIIDGSIQPLVPVLRDNMWLTVHVLTIMLGYAAFFLALALGHVNLGLFFFAPTRKVLLHDLTRFLYRAMQAGTLFLAAGTLLGGVWASYSWGRFWGWDPKETWSLIALLVYLAILHARMLGWIREFGLAVGALIGGLAILMAWYGVNFILGTGLHAYGFGSGGYAYVGGFVAFELFVIAGAFLRLRRLTPPAPAVGAPAAVPASGR